MFRLLPPILPEAAACCVPGVLSLAALAAALPAERVRRPRCRRAARSRRAYTMGLDTASPSAASISPPSSTGPTTPWSSAAPPGGLSRLVSDGNRALKSSGQITGAGVLANGYYLDTTENGRTASVVNMRMRQGTIVDVAALPPLPVKADRGRALPKHKQRIVDPLSAMIAPLGSGRPPPRLQLGPSPSSTAGSAAISASPTVDGRGQGRATAPIRARYYVAAPAGVPVAGHRPSREAVKFMEANTNLEVWLALSAAARADAALSHADRHRGRRAHHPCRRASPAASSAPPPPTSAPRPVSGSAAASAGEPRTTAPRACRRSVAETGRSARGPAKGPASPPAQDLDRNGAATAVPSDSAMLRSRFGRNVKSIRSNRLDRIHARLTLSIRKAGPAPISKRSGRCRRISEVRPHIVP